MVDADELLILTSVEHVAVGYHTNEERQLEHISVAEAKKYMEENQFDEKSVLPKIEAAVSFVEQKTGRRAVITSIDKAIDGYNGKTGTIIES